MRVGLCTNGSLPYPGIGAETSGIGGSQASGREHGSWEIGSPAGEERSRESPRRRSAARLDVRSGHRAWDEEYARPGPSGRGHPVGANRTGETARGAGRDRSEMRGMPQGIPAFGVVTIDGWRPARERECERACEIRDRPPASGMAADVAPETRGGSRLPSFPGHGSAQCTQLPSPSRQIFSRPSVTFLVALRVSMITFALRTIAS